MTQMRNDLQMFFPAGLLGERSRQAGPHGCSCLPRKLYNRWHPVRARPKQANGRSLSQLRGA
jgi:hypothetical protein